MINPHPGPVAELDFWAAKSKNLDSIFDQLQSVRVHGCEVFGQGCNRPITRRSRSCCKELFHARAEANDNVKFLAPLRKWVEQLEDCSDYSTLPEVYPPIVHTILLMERSGHYNTPTRLVVLVREVCNALVQQSQQYLREHERLFELIESEDPNDARGAVQRTQGNSTWLAAFKEVYLKYKDKAATECPVKCLARAK